MLEPLLVSPPAPLIEVIKNSMASLFTVRVDPEAMLADPALPLPASRILATVMLLLSVRDPAEAMNTSEPLPRLPVELTMRLPWLTRVSPV